MTHKIDVVVGLQWGDEGKGRVIDHILSQNESYDLVARFSGGENAGHTIVKNGMTYKTRAVPSGILSGKKCFIGPACVINPESIISEMHSLKDLGFDISLIKISKNTHLVQPEHIDQDKINIEQLGSTGKGIGPAQVARYSRKGIRAHECEDLFPFLASDDLFESVEYILAEGAQGVNLDIDSDCYPFVTSSITRAYGALSLGPVSPKSIRNVFGVIKPYVTYVGKHKLPDSRFLDIENFLQTEGKEWGTVTGRKRDVRLVDLKDIRREVKKEGVTKIFITKLDIVDKCLNRFGYFPILDNGEIKRLSSSDDLLSLLREIISDVHGFYHP